ncbi:ABC transporter ATP-binding protein [Brucella anthropi]|uniref:ABC transporter ATP-binding protein n=1 Tax=Brucella anthropi TaxID=529 RepID=UPI00124D5066|nr:ABC transporter ATP-binding protein [Brucella anthropi]KAB2755185.1 ABC transporter ATP-binding protein [Brucella anthropi]
MPKIHLQDVSIDFPVYNASSRSFKKHLVKFATGGRIHTETDKHVSVRSLEKISCTLNDGDRVGLIGHNGAGKTTLLRVLSGIYVPPLGKAVINGKVASLINISLGIDPEATGLENIRMRAALMGMSRAELEQQFSSIADFTELGSFLEMPFRTYSSGMQLRLAFSIATSVKPEILIMDEWLSTGDDTFREKATSRLNSVIESSKILVLASHSRSLIEQNCNRVIWLEHGTIKKDGPVKDVLNAYYGIGDK